MNESRTLDSRPEYRVTQEPSDEEKAAVYQSKQKKVSSETESKCVMKGPKE